MFSRLPHYSCIQQFSAWIEVSTQTFTLQITLRIFFTKFSKGRHNLIPYLFHVSHDACFLGSWFFRVQVFQGLGPGLLLFRMGFFGAPQKAHLLPKICHRYSTVMKLSTVICYLRKIQMIYKSLTHPLSSADISIFSPEIRKFCYIKYRYILHFDT